MEYEQGKFPSAGIPMGAVVTASGTGAEMNSGAVITYEDKLWKGAILGTSAVFAVLDSNLYSDCSIYAGTFRSF